MRKKQNFSLSQYLDLLLIHFKNVSLHAQLVYSSELPLSGKIDYCLKRLEREYFIIVVKKVQRKPYTENIEDGMAHCFAAMETVAKIEKIGKV